jgi:hypothetical protein
MSTNTPSEIFLIVEDATGEEFEIILSLPEWITAKQMQSIMDACKKIEEQADKTVLVKPPKRNTKRRVIHIPWLEVLDQS